MKRLRLSRNERTLLGVCGGIADYFQVDPVAIRVAFIIMSFMGVGLVAYLLMAFVMNQ